MEKFNELNNAKILDAALEKFRGNISYLEVAAITEEWYSTFTDNVYVSENSIKELIADGMIERFISNGDGKTWLKLTDKGWSCIGKIKSKGYVAQYKKKIRNKIWVYVSGFLAVATFLLVLRRDFLAQKFPPVSSPETSKPQVPLTIHDTPNTIFDTNKVLVPFVNDTTPKQALQKKIK